MSTNHLIIGLGGTGGKIIRAFRKTIYQEFRKEKPAGGVNLGYLYVDSSPEMMGIDDPSWKIFSTSLQLGKNSQLLITDANLSSRLENINNYPGIKPWIGSRDSWKDILRSTVGATLGGQKRRLGRFLFACKSVEFRQQLQLAVKELQDSGQTDAVFHVCVGLAGGTGSGSLIDVLAQIRDLYPSDLGRYRILVYALLPDTYPNPNWDTGNYHANGFAALLELNALSAGRYEPYDVTGVKGRLKNTDSFNGCYLFTNENENGVTVDVNKEVPNIVADFLYQKIVAVKSVSWDTLRRQENGENGNGEAETAPGGRTAERSKRFLTFGIKRLAIPEEEIREYLTYNFSRQAALQLRFNNWTDITGFSDEPKNLDFNEFVRQKETLELWLITDEHLCLSIGILSEDASNKKWKRINNEWMDVIPNFKSLVRESENKPAMLDNLSRMCQQRYEQDYRGIGVQNFYKTKLKAKKDIAKEIRRHVEKSMFDDWRNGIKSMQDVSRLLAALIGYTEERLKNMDDKLSQMKDNEEKSAQKLKLNSAEWANINFVMGILGKTDKVFDAHADILQELYIYRTRIEGLGFAKQLTQELVSELNDLKSETDRAASTISQAIEKFNDNISGRLVDGGKATPEAMKQQLIRFYDSDLVKKVTRRFIIDETEQRTQTSRVRASLISKLGENVSFKLFNERVGKGSFIEILETECEANAKIAHDNLVTSPQEKILGVSIIDKLKERYGSDKQALKTYISELVGYAGNYISFEPLEQHKKAAGIPDGVQTCVSSFTVILPKSPEHTDFIAVLKEAFKESRSTPVEFIESDVKPNEITLVGITNLFPLRFLRHTQFLKDRYDLRVKGSDPERAKLELHGEGDGSQFPNLFVASQEELKKESIPYLLLAKSLGLVEQIKNPETGTSQFVIAMKDDDGFDAEPIYLGKVFSESADKLDVQKIDAVKKQVGVLLLNEYVHEEKRKSLQAKILAEVTAIKTERGGNLEDALYKQFLEGGKRSVKIIKQED